MNTVINGGTQLMEVARRVDFLDIARKAESLRQQLLTARSKLSHLVPAGEGVGKMLY